MQQRAVNCDCKVSLTRLADTNGPRGSTPAQSREQYACAPSARRVSVHRPPRRAVANPSATSEPGHGRAADIPTLQKKLWLQKIGQRVAYVLLTVDLNQGWRCVFSLFRI